MQFFFLPYCVSLCSKITRERLDIFSGFVCCRFVTRQELERLGMTHLIGSSLLRAYMHGFFIHNKLYQKAKTIVEPNDYAALRKQRIQSKMEEARQQRITLKRKLPKVNLLQSISTRVFPKPSLSEA